MRSIRLSIILITLILIVFRAGASETDEAIQLYYEGEYSDALELMEPAFKDNPTSTHLYNYYLHILLELEAYEKARNELDVLQRSYPDLPRFAVDIGYIYREEGNDEAAEKQFEKIIENLTSGEERINTTGNALQRRNETEWAIRVYEAGRVLRGEETAFMYQLAGLYQSTANYDQMFAEYLNILAENPEYKTNVQNNIQEIVREDDHFEKLRVRLIQRVQRNPDNAAYTELLSWLFIQREDYDEAFRQLRAIDRRLNEEGKRLFDLAEVAVINGHFDIAEEIYRYVANMGEDGRHYMTARRGLLDVQYNRLQAGLVEADEVSRIADAYQEHIDVFGYNYRGAGEIFLRYAEIKALYQDLPEEAIKLLDTFMERGRGNREEMARAKLDQARYFTFLGKTWRATLLYGQVDKDFKDHPLGHEAKFNNAKLSFYRGEFQWAKAQLDILKGATSDVIANDALQLSLLIKDAIGLDTTAKPLELYAAADLLIFRKNYNEAMDLLDQIMTEFPGHEIEDNVLMAKARIMMQQRNYEEALSYYEDVYRNHPDGIVVDEALYRAARIQIDRFDNITEGVELLESLLFDHPDSFFTVDARREYRELRGQLP